MGGGGGVGCSRGDGGCRAYRGWGGGGGDASAYRGWYGRAERPRGPVGVGGGGSVGH